MATLVSFRDATLGYGGTPALSGLTLDVVGGGALALVGPNGGGKTTLMRAVVGGCQVLSGRVSVTASRIGLVPQSADLDLTFPVSAAEVVTMGLIGEAGWGKRITADMRRRVGHALERVNLADRASRRFGTLSGGQRQRVLVARALVARPELVMMDEPFNGLDAPSRDIITRLIASLTEDGVGVVVSTHDLSLARDVCSRACVLASRLVALGPTNEALASEILARAYGSSADEAIASLS
ncbi:metal ABC transporter ATP-binding protein [uncultured Actinomyces sp.]|uniref:metal ABC transporter ATP-binding protein n=1 Tax=uncultured Actinomyces sp. TaxID=249061 RepID=UPI0028EF5E5E|nr:metal ABC transporter ATP-binding protein [uncultured Actinomyces sp.]